MKKFDIFILVFCIFLIGSKIGMSFWKSKGITVSKSLAEGFDQNSTSFVRNEQADFDFPEGMPQARLEEVRDNQSVPPQEESNELTKEELLGIDYYQAKKSEEELMRDFNRHLSKLQKFCEASEYQVEELEKILADFIDFLRSEARDPYMIHSVKLKFKDVLSSIEDHNGQPVTDVGDFTLSYRRLYNLSEDVGVEDYPSWAQVVHKAIRCTL